MTIQVYLVHFVIFVKYQIVLLLMLSSLAVMMMACSCRNTCVNITELIALLLNCSDILTDSRKAALKFQSNNENVHPIGQSVAILFRNGITKRPNASEETYFKISLIFLWQTAHKLLVALKQQNC